MFCAWLRSTSRFITNGLNSSSAIAFGRPHWCSFSCEPATVELDHRPQVRRDHRDAVEHHAHRAVVGGQERGDDLEPLQGAGLALALAGLDRLAQVVRLGLQVEGLQPALDRGGTHGALEVLAEPLLHGAVEDLVALQVLDLQVLEPGPDLVEAVDLALRAVAQLLDLTLGTFLDLAAYVGLGALGLELRQVLLELLHPGLDVVVAPVLELLALDVGPALQRREVAVPRLFVDVGDHVRREVDDLLQVLRGEVEQVAESRRDTLEVPDVGDRRGQLDVAHPLAAHLGTGDLYATPLTDDALEANTLVLAAVALPV